jgi:hypothetical protein
MAEGGIDAVLTIIAFAAAVIALCELWWSVRCWLSGRALKKTLEGNRERYLEILRGHGLTPTQAELEARDAHVQGKITQALLDGGATPVPGGAPTAPKAAEPQASFRPPQVSGR